MKLGVFANKEFIDALNELNTKELPVKTAYKITKIYETLSIEERRFVELKRKLIESICEKNEKGEPKISPEGTVQIPKSEIENTNKKLAELANIEFEVQTLSLNELGDIKLSPKTLTVLRDIIEISI